MNHSGGPPRVSPLWRHVEELAARVISQLQHRHRDAHLLPPPIRTWNVPAGRTSGNASSARRRLVNGPTARRINTSSTTVLR